MVRVHKILSAKAKKSDVSIMYGAVPWGFGFWLKGHNLKTGLQRLHDSIASTHRHPALPLGTIWAD